jgi:hypothetical protein
LLAVSKNGDVVEMLPNGLIRVGLSGATLKAIAEIVGISPNEAGVEKQLAELFAVLGMEAATAAVIGFLLAGGTAILLDAIADNGNHLNLYFDPRTGQLRSAEINGNNLPPYDPRNLIPAHQTPAFSGERYCPDIIDSCKAAKKPTPAPVQCAGYTGWSGSCAGDPVPGAPPK